MADATHAAIERLSRFLHTKLIRDDLRGRRSGRSFEARRKGTSRVSLRARSGGRLQTLLKHIRLPLFISEELVAAFRRKVLGLRKSDPRG